MRVLLALVVLSQCGARRAQQQAAAANHQLHADNDNLEAASKSLDFVNKVREDLRRNNDDYALLEGQNRLENPAAPAHPAPRQPGRKRGPRQHYSRRGDGDADQALVNQVNQSATAFRSVTHAHRLKSLRVSKLMKRLNRDKNMLRMRDLEPEETEDKTSYTIPTTTTTSPATWSATPAPAPRRVHTPQPPPPSPPAPPAPLHDDYKMLQELPRHSRPPRRPQRNPAPLPDQIDMAHARNPLITRIRLKGRLCQRTLMNIEGPTYDREGKEVMPEHVPRNARGRLFHQTRAPVLVLPKCCNCCKKSVLGCQ